MGNYIWHFNDAERAYNLLLKNPNHPEKNKKILDIAENSFISYTALKTLQLSEEHKIKLYLSLLSFNFPACHDVDLDDNLHEKIFQTILKQKKLRTKFCFYDNPTSQEWETLVDKIIEDKDFASANGLIKRKSLKIPEHQKDKLESLILMKKLIK
jgi:hypothetical protein